MYNETALLAGKIYDDTRCVQGYSKELLKIVKKEFSKRNINRYDYERFINVLTCLNLQVDDIKHKLDRIIDNGRTAPGIKIDVKI